MGNCCPGCSLTLAMQVLEQLRLHGEGLGLEGSCRGNFVLLKMVFLALLEFPQEVGTEYDGSRRPSMVAMPSSREGDLMNVSRKCRLRHVH
jgi:hypothetical protein